jgi:uncharacterized membrane protein YjdF
MTGFTFQVRQDSRCYHLVTVFPYRKSLIHQPTIIHYNCNSFSKLSLTNIAGTYIFYWRVHKIGIQHNYLTIGFDYINL